MKLFIGNLPFRFKDDDLLELFSEYNPTSYKVIVDRETGRSKGFGFVEFDSKDVGEEVIKSFNGKEIDNRALVVNEARPQENRPKRRQFN